MLSLIYFNMSDKKRVSCPDCGFTRMVNKVNKYDGTSIRRCRDCQKVYARQGNSFIFNTKEKNKY